MTEPITPDPAQTPGAPKSDPAPAKKSLEESLAALDEETRTYVLGEVSKTRNEAKGLRDRLKASEPKVAEFDRLAAASKSDMDRAQEALTAAEQRATEALTRVAKAEVKAALAAVVDNADSIIEDLDLSRFIDDKGEINTAAVSALTTKYAGFSAARSPRPDASQGSGANGGATAATPASALGAIIQQAVRGR